ncbi:hypothetical protein BDB00DRAFT_142456 [Zychaea mexicana]|uniref:uncharacterized protein n=1 Tax=Zychaea mexicana TaxID=64656 RepID=UPI0022FE70D2|nr:uncharacterized protein BDB00DRAFT_142456 [Zychaea mexicana]KAI9496309.1 hypothetical protein BDB00DRAFT_142456 [Zychaea mexicana]
MSFASTTSDDEDPHSFDSCPLRTSSSLFIVKQQDQTIVTATDEIFNILGYAPSDVIGKTISQLLKTIPSPDNTFPLRCVARDKRGTRIKFQACIHRDPLLHRTTTAPNEMATAPLDYWLVRPLNQEKTSRRYRRQQHHRFTLPADATTVIMLSPYGIVDRIYHVIDQELQPASSATRQLIGMPIMAFIHSEDLQILCGQLNMTYRRIQPTFDVRWLTKGYSSKDENDMDAADEYYQWITVTGMPITHQSARLKRRSQITCVIEPIALHERDRGLVETIQDMLELLYDALVEKATAGKIYVLEFLEHVLMNIIPLAVLATNSSKSNDDDDDNNNDVSEKFLSTVQILDKIEFVPLAHKVQSSCKAVLEAYYSFAAKDCFSVSKAIGNITQVLPPAQVPILESYIEWVTTAIRPPSSSRIY